MANLIFNTVQARLKREEPKSDLPPNLENVSYHVQCAMEEMKLDPIGDLKWEQHRTKIYHLLNEIMKLVVTPPRDAPNPALQSDLAAVMGGVADGTTEVPKVSDESSTPE